MIFVILQASMVCVAASVVFSDERWTHFDSVGSRSMSRVGWNN